ncbi:MAG TPA: BNR-repeat neuraminidase N-terminal domain-containing protein, partial [Bacteroidota bacterium]|nr:BNR-repeat neuraminidase N-terminal domain-containing protein [Bacteroidota bacterium]
MLQSLFIALLLFTGGGAAYSQVLITLGSGTNSTTGYDASPVSNWYQSSHMQFVYTATEINTALSPLTGPRDMTKIGWYVTAVPGTVPLLGYTIRLKHTTATNATTYDNTGGFTTVWTGNYTPVAGGYDTLTFTTPFAWDGSSNILVDVCFNITAPYTSTGTARYYSNVYGDFGYYWDDGNNTCTYVPYWNNNSYKPQCAMRWVPATPMSYISSTTIQPNTSAAPVGYTNQEIIGMQVVTSGSLTPMSATSFSLSTTGTTSASDILSAKVYYTGSSATFATTNLFGTQASPSGSFTVNGSQTLAPGVNYFWLAYDISAAATPGNVVDAQCNSITIGGTGRTPTVTNPTGNRALIAPFNGVYTINPAGSGSRNFVSFTAAINALKAAGVSGPTIFQVAAATYNERLWIDPIPGTSAVNTVTFDGGTGNAASRIISGNPNVWDLASIVKLRGADYLRFKNLTVQSTNANYGYGFYFTGGADYNTIDSCIINISQTTMTDSAPIVGSGDSTYYYYNGNSGSYNTISNSQLNGGYYGIQWYGQFGPTSYSKGNQFIKNTVNNFYYYGAYFYTSDSPQLLNNTFTARANNQWSYGIMMYYIDNSPKIIGNKVTAGYSALYMYYTNQYAYTAGDRAKVINNFLISNGTGVSHYTFESYYDLYMDVWFNSIHSITNSTSYIAYLYGSSGYGMDFRNNYMVYSGTGAGYLLYNN